MSRGWHPVIYNISPKQTFKTTLTGKLGLDHYYHYAVVVISMQFLQLPESSRSTPIVCSVPREFMQSSESSCGLWKVHAVFGEFARFSESSRSRPRVNTVAREFLQASASSKSMLRPR